MQTRCRRRGVTATELIVAATLLVSLVGLMAPMMVRTGRTWQSARHYRLALNELSNQLELLTSLDEPERSAAMGTMTVSMAVQQILPEAKLTGQLLSDEDGTRIQLTIDWQQTVLAAPLTLVGWLDTLPSATSQPIAPAEDAQL